MLPFLEMLEQLEYPIGDGNIGVELGGEKGDVPLAELLRGGSSPPLKAWPT